MKIKFSIIAMALCSVVNWAQKPVFTQAKIESARVYFNGAELMHKAKVKLPKGTSEVIVSNVADYLNAETVQVGSTSGVTVMAIQFNNRYVEEYDSVVDLPLLKPVRDSITLLQTELRKVQNALTAERKTIDVLDSNTNVGVQNGSSVLEVTKMVDYYKTKRLQLTNEVDRLTDKERSLTDKLTALKNKLEFSKDKSEKSSKGKLILQVMNDVEGEVPLQIKYYTNQAGWKPFYDLRVEKINSPIKVVYKAEVKQQTGVDWKGVNLSLTSGVANQSNSLPKWNTWFLNYGNSSSSAFQEISLNGYISKRMKATASYDMATEENVVYEESTMENFTQVNESQLNVSFDISIPYTVLTNGKPHSVTLNDFNMPAEYKYYTAPKLDSNAYLVATIRDYGNYNLLPGIANVIFDGVYVGKTALDPANTEEEMKLNMGKDPKVVVTRTVVKDKSGTKILSSKKTQKFVYDIAVRNNKAESIDIQIEDQFPISSNTDIEVELTDTASGKVDVDKGGIKWELKLKGNENKILRFGYQVKYDKNQYLSL
ncbi:DUF4139 domain-containing protein [Myroides pelagicus]|uniref:Mucoidy inhibitor MuiA family protein n=1 Tax=Myroides pelagicus TaxID=270914 RepID=A0A7K1GL01_9FLAO|nr:DUF4139 domain-containing protein [Myroides pelagicus]MEC4113708.1 DUF4139 domain-containing protein [Myroides pelagicus]MTH28904.1 mucoidy inhibitor MuiA family protein [Myroides pelagicus]